MNFDNNFKYIFLSALMSIFSLSAGAQNVECEDTCQHIHGIDISHYQHGVFWDAVGSTKMAYVYIKATEGGDRIDSRYEENIQMARQHGIKVGSYHFYRPKADQEEQLLNFLTQCRPEEQDLIPMIDVETTARLDSAEFCDSLFKFLELVEHVYKQKPLIYTGANFYDKYLREKLDRYLIMIAQYTEQEPVLADGRDITLWQYTGKGRLAGINGYVDKSRFMGNHTLRELRFRQRKQPLTRPADALSPKGEGDISKHHHKEGPEQ